MGSKSTDGDVTKRRSSTFSSPSFSSDTWKLLRRKKKPRVLSDDNIEQTTVSLNDDLKQCNRSRSMPFLDRISTLSAAHSCDNLADKKEYLLQGSPESDYQLWVRTGKNDPPYPLIGKCSVIVKFYLVMYMLTMLARFIL